jgi:DNA-binding SARP family transcriptional activator
MTTTGNAQDSRFSLRVLGGFEVRVVGSPVTLPTNAQRVLGALAVAGAVVRRDVLAGKLWGLTSQSRAQANLRTALWRIGQAAPGIVRATRDSVGLGPELEVDYVRMMTCAHALVDGAAPPVDLLATTPSMLEGDLLPGWEEDWLLVERERHRQLRMHALEALSRHLMRIGEYGRAVDAAYAAIGIEPLYESAQIALVEAHLAEGNRAEAIRHFVAFRRLLHEETGLAPSAPLVALLGDVLGEPHGRPRAPGGRRPQLVPVRGPGGRRA